MSCMVLTMGAGGCANSFGDVKDMIVSPEEEELPLVLEMMAEPATIRFLMAGR